MNDTTNTTYQKLFEEWFKDGTHPEELLLGMPMSLKQAYSEYYKEQINDRMETRKPIN